MSQRLYVFPDAQVQIGLVLRDALSDRTESYVHGASVSGEAPSAKLSAPVVQVAVDGEDGVWPITAEALVRITSWHPGGRTAAHNLAQLCRAILMAHSGEIVQRITRGGGIITDRDPDIGDHFATFTVTATLRSSAL